MTKAGCECDEAGVGVLAKAFMLACLVGLVLATNVRAQEWTGWRGPNRDGIVQVAGPATWPETLHARWSVPVGEGYASPLFSNG
ncbi:MAG: hypothetical protein V3U83_07875, partial [Acidobacteriota bacterium]